MNPINIDKLCKKCAIDINDKEKHVLEHDLINIVHYANKLKDLTHLLDTTDHQTPAYLQLRTDHPHQVWQSRKKNLTYTSGQDDACFLLPY